MEAGFLIFDFFFIIVRLSVNQYVYLIIIQYQGKLEHIFYTSLFHPGSSIFPLLIQICSIFLRDNKQA